MNRAKQLRLDCGSGITAAAERIGISPMTLKKLERGEEIGAAQLHKVGQFYGVPASSLLAPARWDGLPQAA